MRRPLLALPAAALAVALLAGCGGTADGDADTTPTGGDEAAADRVVETIQGEVTVPGDPERIVVLNSALTGFFYALEVPVVGSVPLNTESTEFPPFWADEAAADGTEIVPWSNDGFDLEAILLMAPDLIVAGGQGFPGMQAIEAYEQLTEIAPTVIVDQALPDWHTQLAYIAGDVLDRPEDAQALEDTYAARAAQVRDAITVPPTPVAYLLMLPDLRPFSIPEESALPQAMAELGFEPQPLLAENPHFEPLGSGDSFEMSTEQVAQAVTAPTVFVLGFQSEVISAAELGEDPTYGDLPAFQAGRAYDLPYWAHRADYQTALELLDHIEAEFG
ncbi:ABC transporter substrate-binding protein [Occultella kanbiaonis]|uniref:ABC transporter substrate-binding protein n=1 Tax=Occultella kanbiaonis TaxID=2675754 RepID=UPI001B354E23|nr:ABC transporter substrate-binding protein [Occultella kanbiaonis]